MQFDLWKSPSLNSITLFSLNGICLLRQNGTVRIRLRAVWRETQGNYEIKVRLWVFGVRSSIGADFTVFDGMSEMARVGAAGGPCVIDVEELRHWLFLVGNELCGGTWKALIFQKWCCKEKGSD